ncbi:MAG: hypothetical protein AB2551_17365 [Candidatus Thiodiazotropha sp.]
MSIPHSASFKRILLSTLLVTLFACGGGGGGGEDETLPPSGDADGDGLTNQEETAAGTEPLSADSDGDRLWDGAEIKMYNTNPLLRDTDGDNLIDGADPQPTQPNQDPTDPTSGLSVEYGVFTDNATGSNRQQISSTRYEQNHVVYAPESAANTPFLIYQTYIEDVNSDTLYNEADLSGSAIAIMNADGENPRFLTDLDPVTGFVSSNNAVDATPEPSPDGQHIIFVSDRHNPGSFQLRLYVMDIDGGNQIPLSYDSNPPDLANGEIDADPYWGTDNLITFKRQRFNNGQEFSRVYTATIDPTTMTLSNLVERTTGSNTVLSTPNGPGDFDPKLSPDGTLIASYRHLSDSVVLFGDYDIWIGPHTDPEQPTDASISFIDTDPNVAGLFPRWNLTGDKLAAWQLDGNAVTSGEDPLDIVIYDLTIETAPFSVTATKVNITSDNDGWFETMPSWHTDPTQADTLVYSGSKLSEQP